MLRITHTPAKLLPKEYPVLNTLGRKLKRARQRVGLTQDQIAEALGIDRTAVVKWESQKVEQMVSPERDRLVAFAAITRTPVGWFLEDTDPESALPELLTPVPMQAAPDRLQKVTISQHARKFWDDVSEQVRTGRPDLWSRHVWSPKGPDWQRPLLPDILTDRAAVDLMVMPRPYFYTYAQHFANLLAFQKTEPALRRLVALDWRMPPTPDLSDLDRAQIPRFCEAREKAAELAERLGVAFIQVENENEAAAYLRQIL